MTKDELKHKFHEFHWLTYSPHLASQLWDLIDPYFDESKFTSQDEKDFEKWFKENGEFPYYPDEDTSNWWKRCAKLTWLAARKK